MKVVLEFLSYWREGLFLMRLCRREALDFLYLECHLGACASPHSNGNRRSGLTIIRLAGRSIFDTVFRVLDQTKRSGAVIDEVDWQTLPDLQQALN